VLGPVGQPFIFEERRISEVFRPSRPERLCSAGLLLRTLVRAAGFWLAETSGVGRDTIGKQIRALRLGDSGPAVQLQGLFRHEAADEEQIRAATELAKSEADALETEARRLRLQDWGLFIREQVEKGTRFGHSFTKPKRHALVVLAGQTGAEDSPTQRLQQQQGLWESLWRSEPGLPPAADHLVYDI
jgi:hypothetical protein